MVKISAHSTICHRVQMIILILLHNLIVHYYICKLMTYHDLHRILREFTLRMSQIFFQFNESNW